MSTAERIVKWKQKLLDLGKRNRLINFKETKRTTVKIVKPSISEVFNLIVNQDKKIEFVLRNPNKNILNYDIEDDTEQNIKDESFTIMTGQVLTDKKDNSLLNSLYHLKAKAKTALEEQGINILYLAFGFLQWTETSYSNVELKSPIVLVPVVLELESVLEPYKLRMADDDVVVNPALQYKLENDFGITLNEISDEDDLNIEEYLSELEKMVLPNGWKVSKEIQLSLFSFLKLNMYNDLDKYTEKIQDHPIIKAISGDTSDLKPVPEDIINGIDFDNQIRPIDTFQVVDADSSQQDAIIAAKRGVSFVLQGPPGTGKSQTITNIIAECLASGKTVLFVSEKMAALDVVYRRLRDVGLTDFCLQLHSHKANKKDVVNELGRTLMLPKTQATDSALDMLEQLGENRDKLNEYVKAIHTKCDPLGKTIYQIHGKLIKYQNAPDLIFSFENAGQKSQTDVRKYETVLEKFAMVTSEMGNNYMSNPWRNCNIKNLTFELQHDITIHFNKLNNLLRDLFSFTKEISKALFLEQCFTLNSIENLQKVLAVAALSTCPPVNWFFKESITPVMEEASLYNKMVKEYQELKNTIKHSYKDEIFTNSFKDLYEKMNNSTEGLLKYLNNDFIKEINNILDNREKLEELLPKIIMYTRKVLELCDNITSAFGVKKVYTLNDVKRLLELGELVSKDPRPLISWFDSKKLSELQKLAEDTEIAYIQIYSNEKKLFGTFDKEIFKLDINSLLYKYRIDYSSPLKFLKRDYYKDTKKLHSLLKNPKEKINTTKIIEYLQLSKDINDNREWINQNKDRLEKSFGNWFNCEYTEWNELKLAIATVQNLIKYFGGSEEIPVPLRELLIKSGKDLKSIIQLKIQLNETFAFEETYCKKLPEIMNIEKDAEIMRFDLTSIDNWAKSVEMLSEVIFKSYDEITLFFKEGIKRNLEEVLNDLKIIIKLCSIEEEILSKSDKLKELFGYYFVGLDTNWDSIMNSLNWTHQMKQCFGENKLPEKFIELICYSQEGIKSADLGSRKIRDILDSIKNEISFVESLFDQNTHDFDNSNIQEICDWLTVCVNNFKNLEDWIDFRLSKELCAEYGLQPFIEEVIKNNINGKDIVNTFFKRFYRLWLDDMYTRFPMLQSFRRLQHEDMIRAFQLLDRNQLKIAQSRVRELLSSKRPNFSSIVARGSEVATLLREVEKRRRIMPLRKLFQRISNLLLTLKPCLLMSPLSVSLFLDPDYFKFDVVIFDEASQICSEDAIGAIFRAKQVVVVGDKEQLPPTNFFKANTGESEFEDDESEDTEVYESILDECSTALHKISLKWHYRSRHEHLIAFSNAKIYKNLITFPSAVEKISDFGVEYIEVQNAFYDRSGTRTNKIEAQKVAELVFEHFRKYPERSLGVIAFSEAQQNEIDVAVRQLRSKYSSFEQFFNEEKEEPFFIKNLENVQGDERDTIIFSIGYAKDQNGIMHMNFGPLSKQGGYRRLNVAITRAKYNVKLVGSIKPTDIDLERTNSEGVKMLRQYIEFAIHGPESLQSELSIPSFAEFDSPFEEEVYKLLCEAGYKVDTQVGCSGYRIDLAVRNPDLSGRYLIGIECDGATYHSARTARERDRLREEVLKMRGWKIHRIWSTDWVKDPISEKNRLLKAIDDAYQESLNNNEDISFNEYFYSPEGNDKTRELIDFETVTNTIESDVSNTYNFKEYKVADIYSVKRKPGQNVWYYLADVINYVVSIEGPIHFDVLSKRILPIFGRSKAGTQIKRTIRNVLQKYCFNKVILKGEFCWPINMEHLSVRIPSNEDMPRPIDYICIEERAEAMFIIAKKAIGINKDDLFIETAKIFGFNRTGGKIQGALNEALELLKTSGRVEEFENVIKIKK
jgi:very-short-patch-repair endonuclease